MVFLNQLIPRYIYSCFYWLLTVTWSTKTSLSHRNTGPMCVHCIKQNTKYERGTISQIEQIVYCVSVSISNSFISWKMQAPLGWIMFFDIIVFGFRFSCLMPEAKIWAHSVICEEWQTDLTDQLPNSDRSTSSLINRDRQTDTMEKQGSLTGKANQDGRLGQTNWAWHTDKGDRQGRPVRGDQQRQTDLGKPNWTDRLSGQTNKDSLTGQTNQDRLTATGRQGHTNPDRPTRAERRAQPPRQTSWARLTRTTQPTHRLAVCLDWLTDPKLIG